MTNIERLSETGIKRTGSPKSGFRYLPPPGQSISKQDRERIRLMRIPPAWKEVAINPASTGRIQAIGKDARGRWQYLYHESHVRVREANKSQRLVRFVEALPKMRSTVWRHLREPGLGRERVMASILRILSTCFMRPGSQVYASENGSYGIATLRAKHVRVKKDVVEFDFRGKSGVQQHQELHDRQVAKLMRLLLKQPGREVFKYANGNGELVKVRRRGINEFIKEIMGDKFSAKDFRTWAGTLICACSLARAGVDSTESRSARKRKVVAAIRETAEVLGNTPAVCKSSYIDPAILNGFQAGKTLDNYFETLEDFIAFRGRTLQAPERSLLKFLKRTAQSNGSSVRSK